MRSETKFETIDNGRTVLTLRVLPNLEKLAKKQKHNPYVLCDNGHLERRITECFTCVMLGYKKPENLSGR